MPHTARRVVAALLLGALLPAAGCVTELDVEPVVDLDPTVAATYDEQALNRLLVTMATPADGPRGSSCVGVMLARDLDDGVPGQDLALPPTWGLELAYRSRDAGECHGVWPQLHRVTEAGSGRGYVDWAPEAQSVGGVPRSLVVDVELWFDESPYVLELVGDPVQVTLDPE